MAEATNKRKNGGKRDANPNKRQKKDKKSVFPLGLNVNLISSISIDSQLQALLQELQGYLSPVNEDMNFNVFENYTPSSMRFSSQFVYLIAVLSKIVAR
jgi:hypothetical protein